MPAAAAFEIHDMDTGKILGAVLYENLIDSEEGFVKANETWKKHHPTKNLHVEEIPIEQYHTALGR